MDDESKFRIERDRIELMEQLESVVGKKTAKVYTHANDIGRVIVSIVNVMQSKRNMHEEDIPTITAAVRQAFNAGRRWGKRETTQGEKP